MGLHKYKLLLIISILTSLPVSQGLAVNWLMLQGTEPAKVTHRPFFFVQPSYTKDLSPEISLGPNAGKRVLNTMVAPYFEDDSDFHFRRARAGVRGNFTGSMHNTFTEKMNYFILYEFAPNLLTYSFPGERERKAAADHLSLTFNHIEGARIRIGLFKTPGYEELYQGIVTQDYIEFTDFTARELLERFATGNRRATPSGGTNGTIGTATNVSRGFNGARDWGIMVFDSFKQDDWDLSYSFMLGRGAGIHESDRAQDPLEKYYYLSAEKDLPGGKGPWKYGIKYYTWLQDGVRVFESDPLQTEYDRKRYGFGIRAQGPLFGLETRQRLDIGFGFADGMIFFAPAGNVKGGDLMFAAEDGNKSKGMYIDYAYFITPKIEAMVRYDRHELLYETDGTVWTDGDERDIQTMAYGIQYHFTPKMKLAYNYYDREVDAPNTDHPFVENVIGSVRGRYSIQFTYIY